MTTKGLHHDRLAIAVNRTTRRAYAGGRLDRNRYGDVLSRRDTAQNTTGVVANETFRCDFIAVLGAFVRNRTKACTYLHTLDRIDTHHCIRNVSIQLVKQGFAQTDRHVLRNDLNARAAGIARLAQTIHVRLKFGNDVGVGSEKWILTHVVPRDKRNRNLAQLAHATTQRQTILCMQPFACHGSCTDDGRSQTG